MTVQTSWFGGLRITPPDLRRAAAAVAISIVGVSAFVVALDLVFRRALPPGYVPLFAGTPLGPLVLRTMGLAVREEVVFRLGLMTVLVVLAARLWRRRPPWPVFVAAIVFSQMVNEAGLLSVIPLYATFRYLAVGCVWGWLYWRHGWLAAVSGHVASHLVLDPILHEVLR